MLTNHEGSAGAITCRRIVVGGQPRCGHCESPLPTGETLAVHAVETPVGWRMAAAYCIVHQTHMPLGRASGREAAAHARLVERIVPGTEAREYQLADVECLARG